jgi:hypothetical protein
MLPIMGALALSFRPSGGGCPIRADTFGWRRNSATNRKRSSIRTAGCTAGTSAASDLGQWEYQK